ncbi:Gfo/Idh/MocA family oxidoreductase [Phaeobacter sp. QD34_3]|uniref:Gfo/Idh/MocA family protein n=1 Tax=unclassified Phaeobacter TaxID=2621772 RepID=UPI00237FA6D1|nr:MULTISPECIES: Gfo/Idh/MocA family oxidoreductase [unclassified Phaeobacter]MDE4134772.1 Gfo/Idh/MocA family oxidoreductase [Phaeobacter sp. QD34_3]MDE4138430.1 Gfo/Idh/MocA family oxidoreductase [Phaeobacter sp. QD34_24]
MTLRAAIIGYGKMGRIRHEAMDRHGGFEVVVACDTALDSEASIAMVTDPMAVYDYDPDVIVCSVPNMMIPDVVCTALERGKHVFSEKPPGRNSGDVRRMIAAEEAARAADANLVLKFGFNHRVHDAIEEAKKLIDAGTMGDLYFMRGVYGKAGGPNYSQNWRNDPELSGGGILIDQGIHMLDLFQMFAGRFTDVQSYVQRKFWTDVPVEDNAFALMKNDDGIVASVHSSATQWQHTFRLELYLRNGFISVDGILSASGSYGTEVLTVALNRHDATGSPIPNPEQQELRFTEDRSWDKEIAEFHAAVVAGVPLKCGTSQQALDVMELVEAIYAADPEWNAARQKTPQAATG